MKFAKQLDENAVPEWREKYLNYKQGKKKLKAAARALRNVERSPPKTAHEPSPFGSSLRDAPVRSFLSRGRSRLGDSALPRRHSTLTPVRSRSEVAGLPWRRLSDLEDAQDAEVEPQKVDERSPLRQPEQQAAEDRPHMQRYGSIIGSPPDGRSPATTRLSQQRTAASLLELPDPALDPAKDKGAQQRNAIGVDGNVETAARQQSRNPSDAAPQPPQSQLAHTGNAYEVSKPIDKPVPQKQRPSLRSILKPRRVNSSPFDTRPAFMRRFLSAAGGTPPGRSFNHDNDVALEAYREVDFRKAEFFAFLEKELKKIEDFYKSKEDDASHRLNVLREQLHIMRQHRVDEVEAAEQLKRKQQLSNDNGHGEGAEHPEPKNGSHKWPAIVHKMDSALDKVKAGQIGLTSKAMNDLGTPSFHGNSDSFRDYVRRPTQASVSYKSAKRKLKAALIEYYRGLELLKSYALLNHTAFRKITKKCDKTLPDMPGQNFMIDRVNRARFVTSGNVDDLLQSTEDYYARYFERGNRKIAVGKLRAKGYRATDFSGSFMRAGFFGGAGLCLAAHGLAHGFDAESAPNDMIREKAGFLLQIYAGYFLALFLVILFCAACRVFKRNKVNYAFIFELDGRHNLDWHQLSEIPALFMLLLGLIMDLNFHWVGGVAMYAYWPVILVGLTMMILLCPFPVYYPHTRQWFMESLWRVFLSGLYSVEFRDLFFGDMFCSETYPFGNIEMFFCLYAKHWDDPTSCTSSGSMLFGFFTTLPGIWRALQCLRRYGETRHAFPHLANAAKYTCTILSYMSLSLWRIKDTWEMMAFFMAMSVINSTYCSFWDIVMDFSLGDFSAKYPLLRKQLQYDHIWWYYAVMIVDPILRFNWIFYIIFAGDSQHASIVSFFISLSEVIRRGIWSIFRVENEQCSNNRHLKAHREPPIPYESERMEESAVESGGAGGEEGEPPPTGESPISKTLRRVGTVLTSSHAEDYVRKRKPSAQAEEEIVESDDEDDGD